MPQDWFEQNKPVRRNYIPTQVEEEDDWFAKNRPEPTPPPAPVKRVNTSTEPTTLDKWVSGGLRTIPAVVGGVVGGTATGAATMGVGTLAGGSIGGAAGAGIGEGLAEWYEKVRGIRKEFNPAQVAVQTGVGAIPFLGKFPGAGATWGQIGKYAGRAALEGGVVNAAATVPTQLAETGELPSIEQAGEAGVMGGVMGGALGGGFAAYPKIRTKGIDPTALPAGKPNVKVVPDVDTSVVPPGGPPPTAPANGQPKSRVPSVATIQKRLGVSVEEATVIRDKIKSSIDMGVNPPVAAAPPPVVPTQPVVNQPVQPLPVQQPPVQQPRPGLVESFEKAKAKVKALPPVAPVNQAPVQQEPVRELPPVEQPIKQPEIPPSASETGFQVLLKKDGKYWVESPTLRRPSGPFNSDYLANKWVEANLNAPQVEAPLPVEKPIRELPKVETNVVPKEVVKTLPTIEPITQPKVEQPQPKVEQPTFKIKDKAGNVAPIPADEFEGLTPRLRIIVEDFNANGMDITKTAKSLGISEANLQASLDSVRSITNVLPTTEAAVLTAAPKAPKGKKAKATVAEPQLPTTQPKFGKPGSTQRLAFISWEHGQTVKEKIGKLAKIKGMNPDDVDWGRDWQNDTKVRSILEAEAEIDYFKERQANAARNYMKAAKEEVERRKATTPTVDTSVVPKSEVKKLPSVEAPKVEEPVNPHAETIKKHEATRSLSERYRAIVAEMDAASAKDIEYRDVLSTGGKAELKKGETWRGRVLKFADMADIANKRMNLPEVETSVVPKEAVKELPKVESPIEAKPEPIEGESAVDFIKRTLNVPIEQFQKMPKEVQQQVLKEWRKGQDTFRNIEDVTPQSMKVVGVKEGKGGLENVAMGGGSPKTLDVIGSSLYSNPRPVTNIKELLQNAFDEHKEHGIKEPIRVLIDTAAKNPIDPNGKEGQSITVRDRGKGLSPEEIHTVLTDVGESGKAGVESAAGGFGFAKASPFLGGKHVVVRSVIDTPKGRMLYTFEGTPMQLKDQKKGVPLNASKVGKEIPTGLEVTTWYDEDMDGFYDAAAWAKDMAERSPSAQSGILLSRPYRPEAAHTRAWLDESPTKPLPRDEGGFSTNGNKAVNSEKRHTPEPFPTKQDTFQAPGAEIDVRYDVAAGKEHQGADVHLLNKGMYQGKSQVSYGESTANVPGNIIADIRAIVEEGHDDYPFSVNREQVKEKVRDAINRWVKENIVSGVMKKRVAEVQKMYDNIDVLVSPTNKTIHWLDDGNKFEPDEIRTISHSPEMVRGLDALTEVHEDILRVADTLGWKANTFANASWTKISERLKKFGLLFQEPQKNWKGEIATTMGIHIPRPDDMNNSVILINLFEHLNLALTKDRPIDELATSLTTTIIHEQAHIPGGGHDDVHSYRDAKLHSVLGKANTIRHFEIIERAFGDGKGNLNPAISRLLQIYNTSRKRGLSGQDALVKIGISSKRRADTSGGAGKNVEGVSGSEAKPKSVETKEAYVSRVTGLTKEQFNKLPNRTRTAVLAGYGAPPIPPTPPKTAKGELPPSGEPPKKKGVEPATIVGKVGRIFYKKFMEANPKFKEITDRLIKRRSASEIIGKQVRDEFKDEIGHISKDEIVPFQEDVENGKYPRVREFFDNLHALLESKGAKVGYKENYLPQMWDNTPEEVAAVFGNKTMREKASFQFRSFIDDYAEGIEKGLKPKMKPLELMDWYAQRVNKLIADRAALKSLRKQGYLVQAKNRTSGMQKIESKYGSFEGYYADPSVKAVLENYLGSQEKVGGGIGQALARFSGKMTNLALSSGLVPNKPLFTAHGANMAFPFMSRSFMEGGIKRNLKALKYAWSPEAAGKYLDENAKKAEYLTKRWGYRGQVENPSPGGNLFENTEGIFGKGKEAANKLSELQAKYFEKPLFDKTIPATKLEATWDNFQRNLKKGMTEDEAGKAAVKIGDSFYSGRNLDLMYHNKNFNTFAKIAMAAPDWFRSTVDLGINVPKSMVKILSNPKDPLTQAYAKAGGRMLAIYAAANLAQKAATGKFMWENSTSDQFTMKLGKDVKNKKTRGLKIFNNAGDFFKIPMQIAKATVEEGGGAEVLESSLEGRGSPLTHAALAVASGEDYKGEKNIVGTRDRYGRQVPTAERLRNTLSQTINFGPPQAAAPYNYATGRMTGEEAIARVAEAPLKYGKKKKNPFAFEPFTPVPSNRRGKSVWDYGR